jgi:hypothetical protein
MQKAIYYVSKLIAARGIIELTDRKLNFTVSPFDSTFGIKDLSIPICSICDIKIEGGDIHPKIVIVTSDNRYNFVLANGQKLYDKIRELHRNPLDFEGDDYTNESTMLCKCGKQVNRLYRYCPWCGVEM